MTKSHNFSPLRKDQVTVVEPTYRLSIVQQPQQARATGRSKRFTGRRTIDPPPVIQVQLLYKNSTVTQEEADDDVKMDIDNDEQPPNVPELRVEGVIEEDNQDTEMVGMFPAPLKTLHGDTMLLDDNKEQDHNEKFDNNDDDYDKNENENYSNIINHTLNPLILIASIIDANESPVTVISSSSSNNNNGPTLKVDNYRHEIKDEDRRSSSSIVSSAIGNESSMASNIYHALTGSERKNNNTAAIIHEAEEDEFNANSNSANGTSSISETTSSINSSSQSQSSKLQDFENLAGTTSVVANMVSDKAVSDDHNSMKAVFVFSNLSVKQDGNYRLRFTLYEFTSFNSLYWVKNFNNPSPRIIKRVTIDSDIFKVYTAKKFPGLTTSSKLSFDLKSSGTKIKVRHSIRSGKKSTSSNSSSPTPSVKTLDRSSIIGRGSIFRRTPKPSSSDSATTKLQAPPESIQSSQQISQLELGTINNSNTYLNPNYSIYNDDTGSIKSFATNVSAEYVSGMTPIVSTMSASSTSSLQSAAHSFGSFFSLGRGNNNNNSSNNNNNNNNNNSNSNNNPYNSPNINNTHNTDLSPLKLLSDVSAQQIPIGSNHHGNPNGSNSGLIPSPPGSPRLDPGSNPSNVNNRHSFTPSINTSGSYYNNTVYPRSRANTITSNHSITRSNSIGNFDSQLMPTNSKTHKLSLSQGTTNNYSRFGHQSEDSLSSRHSTISIQTPTSQYFQIPNNNHLNAAMLHSKRSDQYLRQETESEDDYDDDNNHAIRAPPKKSRMDNSKPNDIKSAIMKIQNIIN